MKKITDEQRAYIIAHINDRPRTKVARDAGVSLNTINRIAHEVGGVMLYEWTRRNPELERIVRENYATMSGGEIGHKYGMRKALVNEIARELGLKHNAETIERLKRENIERLKANCAKCDQKAKTSKWKRKRRTDELRYLSGQPQQTRFKFATITHRAYQAKWSLCKRYGYYQCEGEPYTLLYDEATHRLSERREAHYTDKFRLQFCQCEE